MFSRFRGRRPSASMVVSLVALFFALGGAGYAATQLPPNSVGTRQIRSNAVTWNKIAPRTVGSGRINQALVQTRVTGKCSGTTGAIGQVLQSGKVACNPTAPAEFGKTSPFTRVTGSYGQVTSRPLGAGTFLILGEAYGFNTNTAAPAELNCVLNVTGGASQARSTTVPAKQNGGPGQAALPINLAATVPARGANANLDCAESGVGPVTAAGQINAIRTANNG
jgi:hypothetical protein